MYVNFFKGKANHICTKNEYLQNVDGIYNFYGCLLEIGLIDDLELGSFSHYLRQNYNHLSSHLQSLMEEDPVEYWH